jgi:hypothetical protein
MDSFYFYPRNSINKIKVDSKGYVWVATPANGVYVIDPVSDKIVMHFNSKDDKGNRIPDDAISSVLEYNDSLNGHYIIHTGLSV